MPKRAPASAERLFDAQPLVHPHVIVAYRRSARALRRARIPFRLTGGLALNLHGVGRPTKDIDLIVRKRDWERAIKALSRVASDPVGIRFGLPGEPEAGLAVVGPHGVAIGVLPEGVAHGQIARIRGRRKGRHPAGKLVLTLKGNELVALMNAKIASYLSADDRPRDLADVQGLIKRLGLPLGFARRLAPPVRAAYRRVWSGRF